MKSIDATTSSTLLNHKLYFCTPTITRDYSLGQLASCILSTFTILSLDPPSYTSPSPDATADNPPPPILLFSCNKKSLNN